jgi:hypothetical protein
MHVMGLLFSLADFVGLEAPWIALFDLEDTKDIEK